MARENGENPAQIAPEIKLATKVVKTNGLVIPTNVEELASKYAKLTFDSTLPNGVDGILIRRPHVRPEIIVQSSTSFNRKRFTIAHELGHLLIPWQLGSNACDTRHQSSGVEETEANRFAAALLLPHTWLSKVLKSFTAQDVINVAIQAKVSLTTAMLQCAQLATVGHLFVQTDTDYRVRYSALPPGGRCKRPREEDFWDPDSQVPKFAMVTSAKLGPWLLHVVDHPEQLPVSYATTLWRPIEAEIFADVGIVDNIAIATRQRINGIIGSANNLVQRREHAVLLATLRMRFSNRPDLAPIVNHPRFIEFLSARAADILKRP